MSSLSISTMQIIAQAAPAAAPNPIVSFLPFVGIIAIFYFLIIRPQNKRIKEHKDMLAAITRGDQIVTNGGLVGKVKKVNDGEGELKVDIGIGDVTVKRSMVADVLNRPAPANDTKKK